MLTIARETPRQQEVEHLLQLSDAYAAALYPVESNHMLDLDALLRPEVLFFVARVSGQAVGCGALVVTGDGGAEIKRMFVAPSARGEGVGRTLLAAIEQTATAEGVRLIQLETGTKQPEAIGLYQHCGYRERGPFGAYEADPLSVFMEKRLG